MRTTVIGLSTLAPQIAWASHPGHGSSSAESLIHYVTEPLHQGAVPMLALVAAVVSMLTIAARHRSRKVPRSHTR